MKSRKVLNIIFFKILKKTKLLKLKIKNNLKVNKYFRKINKLLTKIKYMNKMFNNIMKILNYNKMAIKTIKIKKIK